MFAADAAAAANHVIILAAVIAAVPPTLVARISLYTSWRTHVAVTRIEVSVDGNLHDLLAAKDELLRVSKDASYASGAASVSEPPVRPATPEGTPVDCRRT